MEWILFRQLLSCRYGEMWCNRSTNLGAAIQSHWIQSKETNPKPFLLFISFTETVVVAGNLKRLYPFKGRGGSCSKTKNEKKKQAKWKSSKQVEEALKKASQLLGEKKCYELSKN